MTGNLHAQRVGHAFERLLRALVPTEQREADAAADGRDLHDAAGPGVAHVRQREPRQPHRREHEGLEVAPRLVVVDVLHALLRHEGGVVHETPRSNVVDDLGAPFGVVDVE